MDNYIHASHSRVNNFKTKIQHCNTLTSRNDSNYDVVVLEICFDKDYKLRQERFWTATLWHTMWLDNGLVG